MHGLTQLESVLKDHLEHLCHFLGDETKASRCWICAWAQGWSRPVWGLGPAEYNR